MPPATAPMPISSMLRNAGYTLTDADVGGSIRLDRYRASKSTVATLASSDGWPIWWPRPRPRPGRTP